MSVLKIFIVLLFVVAYGILLISFAFVPDKKIPQAESPVTHFPTWHPPFDALYGDRMRSIGLLGIVITLLTSIVTYKNAYFTHPANKKVQTYFCSTSNTDGVSSSVLTSTQYFNKNFAHYNLGTFSSIIAYYIIDPSKLFTTFAVMHNFFELTLLVSFLSGGQLRTTKQFLWLLTYFMSIASIVIYVKWPYDALFFKFQGLILDYALVVHFVRTYLTTKYYVNNYDQRHLDEEDEIEGLSASSPNVGAFYLVSYPEQLLLLIAGSIIHLIANIFNVVFLLDFFANYFVTVSYCITFSLYALYVFMDVNSVSVANSRKYIYLPEVTKWSIFVIGASCTFLSMLTMRIGIARG
nr:4215_t:CDS:2 [Entrophospora candida]